MDLLTYFRFSEKNKTKQNRIAVLKNGAAGTIPDKVKVLLELVYGRSLEQFGEVARLL